MLSDGRTTTYINTTREYIAHKSCMASVVIPLASICTFLLRPRPVINGYPACKLAAPLN